jgi:hypothetical protein
MIADRLHEGKGLVESALGVVVEENTTDAAGFFAVGEIEIRVAVLLELP